MTRDAVIVSTARTGIGRAYRGAFNATPSPTLAAHPIRAAVERAKVDPAEVDDVIMGAALQQGVQTTIGRTAALRAGLPVTVSGMSIDRQCSSGLMSIATAAKQVIVDRMDIVVAGGVESISLVQTGEMRLGPDPELLSMYNGVYMPMIDTAEIVGKRYEISRERCDEYALRSQQRTAAAQASGKFKDEIVSMPSVMLITDKATGASSKKEVRLEKDEGNRADTTLEGLAALKPVFADGQRVKQGKHITAGNAS
ncbi:MAG TPA: acetyl-CoA C-acyltransferase, partial [Sphingomicrobium sp.]